MEMKIGQLGLKIPIKNKDKSSQINIDPESIKKWRALLPMADTGATAKKLYLMLNELNKAELESTKQFEILELIRPPLQLICQALKKHYTNQTTPLTKQKLTIANLAQTLQLEATNGYKTILEDLHINAKEKSKELIVLVIYRIMHYYTMILLRSYQLYSQEPVSIWQELHLLYKLAKKENLLAHKIDVSSIHKECKPNILTSYIHTLLLASTNPFQWRQNEQEIINNILDLWASFTLLREYSTTDQKTPGLYIVDLAQDLPPSPLGLQEFTISKTTLVLDLTKNCSHLYNILTELEENEIKARLTHDKDPEYEIAATTLRRLFNSWNIIITRKYKRFVVNGTMQVIFGLSATHYHVGDGQPFEPEIVDSQDTINKNSQFELTTSLARFDTTSSNNINLELTSPDNQAKKKNKAIAEKEKFVIYNCSLLNISPNGHCLVWESDAYPLVQPGEIIATKTSADNDKTLWNIAVIRWLKYTKNGKMRVGVQLLAPYAKAAGAQIIKDDIPAGYFLRCLILPAIEELNLASSIITPILPFKQGRTINLYTADNQKLTKVTLAKQIDATSSYRQFEYITENPIELINKTNKEQQSSSANNTEQLLKLEDNEVSNKFNSIWDQL